MFIQKKCFRQFLQLIYIIIRLKITRQYVRVAQKGFKETLNSIFHIKKGRQETNNPRKNNWKNCANKNQAFAICSLSDTLFWHSFRQTNWKYLWHIYSDILSGIYSVIFSHSIWKTLSHSIWNLFGHSFWHFFWHMFWNSPCHLFWHSIWHVSWRDAPLRKSRDYHLTDGEKGNQATQDQTNLAREPKVAKSSLKESAKNT